MIYLGVFFCFFVVSGSKHEARRGQHAYCNTAFDRAMISSSSTTTMPTQDGVTPVEFQLFEPTYQTRPSNDEGFNAEKATSIASEVLEHELATLDASNKQVEEWADFSAGFESLSMTIADKVKARCREELHCPRYKILVHVVVAQSKDQGSSITSRCLWDTATDNYASANYRTEAIWASCVVFGLYTE